MFSDIRLIPHDYVMSYIFIPTFGVQISKIVIQSSGWQVWNLDWLY